VTDLSALLQELAVPYQRKGEAWLVEVGGAWATFAWIPREAYLTGFLMYEGRPAPSAELVRANAEPGLAWHHTGAEGTLTRVALPEADLGPASLRVALAALSREARGHAPPAAAEDLADLGATPDEVTVTPHGDFVDLRIALEAVQAAPDDALANWMLEMSALRGARIGVDAEGTVWAVAAVPAPARGLEWGVAQVMELAGLYRQA